MCSCSCKAAVQHHVQTQQARSALGLVSAVSQAHLNLVHQLHGLNDAHGLPAGDPVALLDEDSLARGGAPVEGPRHRGCLLQLHTVVTNEAEVRVQVMPAGGPGLSA